MPTPHQLYTTCALRIMCGGGGGTCVCVVLRIAKLLMHACTGQANMQLCKYQSYCTSLVQWLVFAYNCMFACPVHAIWPAAQAEVKCQRMHLIGLDYWWCIGATCERHTLQCTKPHTTYAWDVSIVLRHMRHYDAFAREHFKMDSSKAVWFHFCTRGPAIVFGSFCTFV